MSEISRRILTRMQSMEMSYGELSKLSGIPKSALQRYAIGQTEKIPIDRLEKIASALGVSTSFLVGWREPSASLGENIRFYREKLGLSQEELAKRMGYKDRSTIAKIENNTNDLTQSKICAFAKALDTTPGTLMGMEVFSEANFMNQEVHRMTEAEWSAFILRSLISYHEWSHMGVLLNEDGAAYCENQANCPAANQDGYLNGLKYALSVVEEKANL